MVSCLRPINVGNCYVFPVPPPPLWLYCIPVLPGFQSVHLLCSTLCTLSKISNDQQFLEQRWWHVWGMDAVFRKNGMLPHTMSTHTMSMRQKCRFGRNGNFYSADVWWTLNDVLCNLPLNSKVSFLHSFKDTLLKLPQFLSSNLP